MSNNHPEYAGYIFDLDGTIYVGSDVVPGAPRTVAALRARGARVLFLSNKPIEPAEAYAQKLTGLGIPAGPEDVLSSPTALADRLAAEAPGASCYLIGEAPVRQALEARGLRLVAGPPSDYVIASWDRDLHYDKLVIALRCMRGGARLVATNPDGTCPVPGGELPDAGAVIAAIEASSGIPCSWVAGKPSPRMLQAARGRLGLGVGECLLVGDRLETDMAMGIGAGMATALVLTGVTSAEHLAGSTVQPTYVLRSVADLLSPGAGGG